MTGPGSRLLRRRGLALLLASAFLLGAALATPSPSAASAASRGRDALQTLAGCVQSTNRLLVLLLIDDSGSLARTDRGNARVTAVKAALRDLSELAATRHAGSVPRVEAQLAGFSVDLDNATGWRSLTRASAADLEREADAFTTRNHGADTDFYLALAGAQRSFAKRVQELTPHGEAVPCQLLMLFTDGEYDIDPRPGQTKPYATDIPLDDEPAAQRVVARGRGLLCDARGAVDQLRSDGVVTVTIALTAEIRQGSQDFLRAVGTGGGGGQRCGQLGGPTTGAFVPVERLSELLFRFDQIASRLGAGKALDPRPAPQGICKLRACPSGRRVFTIDPGLSRFHIVADLGEAGFVLQLSAPRPGRRLMLASGRDGSAQRGTALLGSATITYDWHSPQVATIDADLPSKTRDWVGPWAVTFIDPSGQHPGAVARSQIYLYGDLSPELVEPAVLRLGQSNELTARLVNQDRTPQVPRDLVASASLQATATAPSSGQAWSVPMSGPDAAGRFHGGLAVPATLRDAALNLELALTVRTRSGVTLETIRQTRPLRIAPPVSYPDVTPASLRLPSVIGTEPTRGTLRLVGGQSAGCVWFESAAFTTVPPGAGSISTSLAGNPTARQRCIHIQPGETRVVDIDAVAARQADGRAKGTLVARLASEEPGAPVLTRQIPVSFSMALHVEQGRRRLLFIGLLALLALLPLAVLYLAGQAFAWLQPTTVLLGATLETVVGRDGEPRLVGENGASGQPLRSLGLSRFDSNVGGSPRRRRRLSWESLVFRTRVPWHPLNGPHGVVAAAGQHVTASGGLVRPRRGGYCRGRVPLELSGTWVFALDQEGPQRDGEVRGRLYLFMNELQEHLDELAGSLVADVTEGLGQAARELAAAAGQAPTPRRSGRRDTSSAEDDDGLHDQDGGDSHDDWGGLHQHDREDPHETWDGLHDHDRENA